MDAIPLSPATTGAPALPAPAKPLICGNCFKPVDPETSYKRMIHAAPSRYSRYNGGDVTPPRAEHFCNVACFHRANTDASSRKFF